MTPYEVSQRKKLSQAAELTCALADWRKMAGYDSVSEESILLTLIQQIETASQHFDDQLAHYRTLSEKRRRLASESDDCIKKLTDRLWEDASYQFRGGTVANDLLKILCQKIHRFPLPDFPVSNRNPLHYKTVRLHEDSFALFSQYFGWLVDLLLVVKFTPIRPPHCLEKLSEQAAHFNALTQQIMHEAETLRHLQLTKDQLYKQLYQAVRTAKGRLLVYRRETRLLADHFVKP